MGCGGSGAALPSLQGTEVPAAVSDAAPERVATADPDAGPARTLADPPAGADLADAGPLEPPPRDVSGSCPVEISVSTRSYGSGDEAQDDYAPRNVGAIWISTPDDRFVRTVAAWGPTYFDHALMWIEQSEGSLVDAVTLPTRSSHMRPVEVSWDCRNTSQQLVAAGEYRVNIEFTEVEAQGPALTGERALSVRLGAGPSEQVRAPAGFFGEVRLRVGH